MKIHRAVGVAKGSFVPGQESELAKVLTDAEREHLTKKGAISGFPPGEGAGAELPTLDELPKRVKKLSTVAEVEAMQTSDTRKGAEPIYAARLKELSEVKE